MKQELVLVTGAIGFVAEYVIGELLSKNFKVRGTIRNMERIAEGKIKYSPHLEFGIVDVRDSAELGVLLMTHPMAAGKRFIVCSDGTWTFASISKLLREKSIISSKIKTILELPNGLARMIALLFLKLGINVSEIGRKKSIINKKAKELGWTPRKGEYTLLDTINGIIEIKGINS